MERRLGKSRKHKVNLAKKGGALNPTGPSKKTDYVRTQPKS